MNASPHPVLNVVGVSKSLMACGLPVIVSRVAGCAPDLVAEDWNGHLVAPKDVESLAQKMYSLATQPKLRIAMGSHSLERISKYSPDIWSTGVLAMTKAAGGIRD